MITFTQYIRPNGETREIDIERSPEVEAKAARFQAAGGSFAAEKINDELVALFAEFDVDGERQDVVTLVVRNVDGRVAEGVDNLVGKAVEFLDGLEAQTTESGKCLTQ